MTIIITLKEPNPEWHGKNVKRFTNITLFNSTEPEVALFEGDHIYSTNIKTKEITSILITY